MTKIEKRREKNTGYYSQLHRDAVKPRPSIKARLRLQRGKK